jgi:hypothetical protein
VSVPGIRQTSRTRRFIRVSDGVAQVRLMAIAGIATVLVTRVYLAAAGYPQVGNGTLHIGHVMWGGLLMIVALTVALVWFGAAARTATALLGGVGIGLFVDEVGKYLTRTGDYFFRPAAAIIYLVFALLLVAASLLGRDRAAQADADVRLAMAARIAADGLTGGLTARERERAVQLLEHCPETDGRDAVLRLLQDAPGREPGRLARQGETLRRRAKQLAELPYAEAAMLSLLAVSHVVVAIVFAAQAVTGEPHSTDAGAITGGAITRSLSALLILAAVAVVRSRRGAAYRLCRAAILADLLIAEVFNFNDSQFAALGELPFLLLALAFFERTKRADSVAVPNKP